MTPKLTAIRRDDTHRLVPAVLSEQAALARLSENEDQVQDLIELEGSTNDRLLGQANLLPGISIHELLFGVANADVVNAAFTHAHPLGSRFNGPERGAWYAAFDLRTAQAEVLFNKTKELREIHWPEKETFRFDDYLADFRGKFQDLSADRARKDAIAPDSYARSQALAGELLALGSAGIVYPSVRRSKGTCLACFRPALVTNVRRGRRITLTV